MKKLNWLSIIFIFSMLLVTTFIFVCVTDFPSESGYLDNESTMDFSDNWRISVNGDTIAPIALPTKLKLKPNDQVLLEKSIPDSFQKNTAICFRSSQQRVNVFVEEELIYSYGYDSLPPFGNSPGSIWNIVRLSPSDAGKTITLELTSPCKEFSGCINSITTGTKAALLFDIYVQYGTTLAYGISLLFTGILILLLLIFLRIYLHVPILSTSTLFLAMFSIITGTWIAIESRLLQFFIDDVFITHYLDFITLAAAPVAMHLYLLHINGYREDKILKVLLPIGVINVWLVFVLHVLNILDFTSTMISSHVVIIATALYVIFSEIKSLISENRPHSSTATTIALAVLISGCFIDFFRFFLNPAYAIGEFVGIGFVGFMLILTLQSFLEFFFIKNEVDRTQILQELAYMDSLTQLGNRTAYEEALENYQREIKQIKNLAIFIADINGLKNINDTFGHSAGDIAISKSGSAIRNTFDKIGKAYRIGGDEFCVICEDITNEKCEYLCTTLKSETEKATIAFSEGCNITVQLSLGYAFYDSTDTRIFSIEELVKRADNAMYAHKLSRRNKSIATLQRDTIEMTRIDV